MSTNDDNPSEIDTSSEPGEDTETLDSEMVRESLKRIGQKTELVVLSGPHAGETIAFGDRNSLVIGRSDEADYTLKDSGVSKQHARVVREEGQTFIEDLDSTNGTYVNGETIEGRHSLERGDSIALGEHFLLQYAAISEPAGEHSAEDSTRRIPLRVGADANWFQVGDDEVVDLRDRAPVRQILARLIELADDEDQDSVHAFDLFPVGWPGETVEPEEAKDRVHGAIRFLRENGLREVLQTGESEYHLAPGFYLSTEEADIERFPDLDTPPDDVSQLKSPSP